MTTHGQYILDGQRVSITGLCRTRGWPRKVVTAALAERDDLTTAELLAIVVASKSRPVYRPVREASRKANQVDPDTYLTKQARSHPFSFASGH